MLGIVSILILGIFIGAGFILGDKENVEINSLSAQNTFGLKGKFCTQVTRADGTIEPSDCKDADLSIQGENALLTDYLIKDVLFNTGANATRDALGQGTTAGPFTNITLCNASAGCGTPLADASETWNAITDCGLANIEGTYTTVTTSAGNWSISHQFTASCDDVVTNVTRLQNVSGTNFAGSNFTSVTLQTNDQLTINWSIWVT